MDKLYIKRDIEHTIQGYFAIPEIIAVVGPRQSGKTTLIKHLLNSVENSISISFEDPGILSLFVKNPDSFYAQYIKPYKVTFIDEFQYAKNGGKNLKYIYDQYDNPKIIVSGSSVIDITIQSLKYLVGRVISVEVYPLSLFEFMRYKDNSFFDYIKKIKRQDFTETDKLKADSYIEEYILYGGYPRVVISQTHEEKDLILKNIYQNFFLREVKDVLGLADQYNLNQIIEIIALMSGNQLEIENVKKMTGFSLISIKKYLRLLHNSFLTIEVRPYYTNKLKEIVKMPKIYFLDTGIRNCIIKNYNPLTLREDNGRLFEHLVLRLLGAPSQKINYWKSKNKHEVDFVRLEQGLIPHGYECKWARDHGGGKDGRQQFKDIYKGSEVQILCKEDVWVFHSNFTDNR